MLSGASKAALDQVFLVQFCPRIYSCDNIAQTKTLCSAVQEAPNNIAQVKTFWNIEARGSNAQEKVLFSVALMLFLQQCTGQNPMQCCLRTILCIRKSLCNVGLMLSGQRCTGKLACPNQNRRKVMLLSRNALTYAMLSSDN